MNYELSFQHHKLRTGVLAKARMKFHKIDKILKYCDISPLLSQGLPRILIPNVLTP